MREVYASFFLLIALYGVISWIKYGSIKSFVLAMAGFICATFFHGGMFLGALVFLTIMDLWKMQYYLGEMLLIQQRKNLEANRPYKLRGMINSFQQITLSSQKTQPTQQ